MARSTSTGSVSRMEKIELLVRTRSLSTDVRVTVARKFRLAMPKDCTVSDAERKTVQSIIGAVIEQQARSNAQSEGSENGPHDTHKYGE